VKDGFLDLAEVYEIEATEAEINKFRLKFGDLLLNEGGDPDKLGRGSFWGGVIPECIPKSHLSGAL
jgi:type I restriction enzyme S subunit